MNKANACVCLGRDHILLDVGHFWVIGCFNASWNLTVQWDFHSAVDAIAIPSVTGLGCITAYIFAEQKGMQSSRRFLKDFFPKKTELFYFRVDFLLSAVIGTCIGVILYSPRTGYQALAAGIGWTAAFNLIKTERHELKQGIGGREQ